MRGLASLASLYASLCAASGRLSCPTLNGKSPEVMSRTPTLASSAVRALRGCSQKASKVVITWPLLFSILNRREWNLRHHRLLPMDSLKSEATERNSSPEL